MSQKPTNPPSLTYRAVFAKTDSCPVEFRETEFDAPSEKEMLKAYRNIPAPIGFEFVGVKRVLAPNTFTWVK